MEKMYPRIFLFAAILFLVSLKTYATNYTSAGTGNWGTSGTWSPSGVPGSSDNVTIAHGTVVTVNGNYTCNNLTLGDATTGVTTVNVSSGYTLTINGACSINPSSVSNTYTLNAGSGTVKISGTFSSGTSGTNVVQASTGTLTFAPAVTISSSALAIKLTGAGTINFNSSFTDNYNKLTPFSGSNVNFAGNYTVSTTAASWASGTAVFSGTGTITANSNLTLYNLQSAASASTTLASASGTVIVSGAITLGSASTLTANENFELDGNFTNSGGTFSGGSNTVTFNGTTTVAGATAFPYLQVGNTAASNTVTATLNSSVTCSGLTINGYNKARTLTVSNGDTLTVNGNVLINQPTAAKTNNLAVNGGTCIVTGTLGFSGTVTTASYVSKITVTTGTLIVAGAVSYDANTVAANQLITLTSTGIVTFSSPLSMAYGTLSITGSGIINFNGSAPSFTFGGASNPDFNSTNGSTINFVNGFVNNSNALTFATTSNTNFTSHGTITANADVTFGNLQFSSLDTLASTGTNVSVAGNCVLSGSASVKALQSLTLNGNSIIVGTGCVYTQSSGTLTVAGDIIDSGNINAISGGSIVLNGSGANMSGTGVMDNDGGTITFSNNKTIIAGSSLTFGTAGDTTTISISAGTTISNSGSIVVNGNITGTDNTSTWLNNYAGALSITGELLSTGALDAATVPNTVTYNGKGNQTITVPLSSYYNLIVANGGTKSMAGAVQADNEVIISNAVTLDEGTNALTGLASLTMDNDSSSLTLQRSATGTYPELTGTYSLTGGTIYINQTANSATLTSAVYYNLDLNGTVAYDISGISTIGHDFFMDNSSTLNNNYALTIMHRFVYESTAYTTLYGDITANGVELYAGTLDDGGHTIIVSGTGGWHNSGGSFNSSGSTQFFPKFGMAQTIGGNTPTTFFNLVINNTGNVTLGLSPAATTSVTGTLDLTSGNLNTDASNILQMGAGSTVLNGSSSSYVAGPMQKIGNTDFIFPIGKSGIYGQSGVSGAVDPTTVVTAEYFPASYSTLTPRDTSLTQISNREYWMIERTVSSDSLHVELFWTTATASDILSCNHLTIAHYTSSEWKSEPAATIGGSVCSGSGSGSVKTTGYVSTFSPFTFGSDAGGQALPVTLVSFNAVADKKVVNTNWQTAVEINNAYFTVERSDNGETFEGIGTVNGAGNSATLRSYTFTDGAPLKGVSYYRLRQTDNNGNSTVSNMVAVDFEAQTSVTVYPNPAVDQVFINITNPTAEVTIGIYDMTGRQVYSKTYQPNEVSRATQLISLPIAGNLPSGVYLVSAKTAASDYNEKLIVQ